MLRNDLLLDQYKEEKSLIVGDDLFETFPTFREWKGEYVREYVQTHRTVPVDLADILMDHIQRQADVELIQLTERDTNMSKKSTSESENKTEQYMNKFMKNVNNENTTSNKKSTAKKSGEGRDLSNCKTTKCRKIFSTHFGKKSRKEIVEMFIRDGGTTENGAKTYYQNFKKKAESQS